MHRNGDPTMQSRSILLATGIVVLTLATAYIHFTLGSLLFLLNAAGYVGLAGLVAVSVVVRHRLVQRFAWLPRIGLIGYAMATIAGYLVIGPYFALGWLAKGIEVVLIGLVTVDLLRSYGSPAGVVRAALASI